MPPRLVIVAGPSRGVEVALEAGEVVLGRDSACGVCLPDATLSRRHAVLSSTPEGWRLRDLGSLNGLRVNGLSTAEHFLAPGDRIELGSSVLVYRSAEPEPGEAPAGHPEPQVLSTIRLPLSEARFAGDAAVSDVRRTERSLSLLVAAGRKLAAERSEEGNEGQTTHAERIGRCALLPRKYPSSARCWSPPPPLSRAHSKALRNPPNLVSVRPRPFEGDRPSFVFRSSIDAVAPDGDAPLEYAQS